MDKQEIINFLASQKENDFTKNVLTPLLKKMGFEWVDFHGGVIEEGKDVIAYRTDAFNDREYWAFQVKRIDDSSITKAKPAYKELVDQIQDMFHIPIKTKTGLEIIPDKIIAVTPNQISTRMLQTKFQVLFKEGKVKVIDGSDLFQQISDNWPTFSSDILGVQSCFSKSQLEELQNKELIAALKLREVETDYEKFYCDLNLFIGTYSTNRILNSQFKAEHCKVVNISTNDWNEFKSKLSNIFISVGITGFKKSFIDTEKKYDQLFSEYNSQENKEKISSLAVIVEDFQKTKCELEGLLASLKESIISLINILTTDANSNNEKLIINLQDDSKQITTLLSHLLTKGYLSQTPNRNTSSDLVSNESIRITNINNELKDLKQTIEESEESIVNEPKYDLLVDFPAIAKQYNIYIKDINDGLTSSESRKLDINETTDVISNLENAYNVLKFCTASEKIKQNIKLESVKGKDIERFEVTAFDIFDTKKNIAVFGMAGAGKSTTLQMYAKKVLNRNNPNDLLIFAPLNRMVNIVSTSAPDMVTEESIERSKVDLLLKCLLLQKGQKPSEENLELFKKEFRVHKGHTIFVFDGLDEVAIENSWIINAINELAKSITKVQVLVSSRDSVNYLSQIEFVGITLLPFTQTQLNDFVLNWGGLNELDSKALITTIINKNLYDVIKNPLLATLVCKIHSQGQVVAENEKDIYKQYIKLLCGSYDSYKLVSRNNFNIEQLQDIASKCAFIMHRAEVRYMRKEEIIKQLNSIYKERYSPDFIKNCINELIDPCNILIKNYNTDEYGFGHFRIQEYLTSLYIAENQTSEDVVSYLPNDWWRGAMYFYADNTNVENIIKVASERLATRLPLAKLTIVQMISTAPRYQRQGLKELLNMFLEQSSDIFQYEEWN